MSPTKSPFFKENILVALDTHAKKINPPSIIRGGVGVNGKACWLIAYTTMADLCYILMDLFCFITNSFTNIFQTGT